MAAFNRTAKDSIFTRLFGIPQYALQLYQSLHPEDREVTEADCEVITLENILTTGIYNDFALLVRGMLVIFAEAQATFTQNITLRILFYVAETYKRYVDKHKLDIYGVGQVEIPRPEVYVVYTGDKKDVPKKLYLSDLYYGGKGSLELEVKVFCNSGKGNILEQYVRFCKIFDENRKKYGPTTQAIEETLRQCLAEGILAPFLTEHKEEVCDMISFLFSQEKIQEIHDYNVAKDARAEGWRDGREEGREEGREDGLKEGAEITLLANLKALMAKLSFTAEEAMDTLGVPSETRIKLLGQL